MKGRIVKILCCTLPDCELTLEDQMHEDSGQVAPCERLWFWNPCRRGSVNVQILAMLNGCRARRHRILDLMLPLSKSSLVMEISNQSSILPCPILSLVFNTASGVRVARCWASVRIQRPAPRGCSLKTSNEDSSTGTREPTRSLSSQ
jgi:hypothetical protein